VNRTDLAVALLFFLLGGYLVLSARELPPGMGRLPGPGFFPSVVGVVIIGLAAALLAASLRSKGHTHFRVENKTALAITAALLLVYLLLWGRMNFAVRTGFLLVIFLRFLGERWKSSLVVAAVLTLAVLLAFQYGLRVDLQ
jgi:hypothetical protein